MPASANVTNPEHKRLKFRILLWGIGTSSLSRLGVS